MTDAPNASRRGPAAVVAARPAPDVDAIIDELAARQHGIVGRAQLLRAGVSAHRIEYRIRSGRFLTLRRGIYRVGPLTGPRAREMAAVLACGETAVLSHRSAAVVWGLAPPLPGEPPVDVSVRRGRRAPGVRLHRTTTLAAEEITRRDGVPITTPERTLLDLAASIGGHDLERTCARAARLGAVDREGIERTVERHPRHRGARMLRALVAAGDRPVLTRSEAEARFLALIRRARIRTPDVNVLVHGHEVDFLWRAERLVVEIDGFAFHASRRAFEADRRRDAVLTAAGMRVLRVTWRQLAAEPEALLARVAQALARTHGL